MEKQVELYYMREPSKLKVFRLWWVYTWRSFRSLSLMIQKFKIHPLVLLVSYAAWLLLYPHLNNVSSEYGIVFIMDFFNLIRRKLMSKDILSAIAEESMKEWLALAISSMKNLETVR